ncbi:MAG: phospholipase D-like domain-containing protein, partial [Gammaproteobacteria bacterium]
MDQDIYTVRHLSALASLALFALAAALHALLNKRDPRSAFGWVALCLFFPLAGPVLYWMFGMNRIRTRARKLERERPQALDGTSTPDLAGPGESASAEVTVPLPAVCARIARVSDALTGKRVLSGNAVQPLEGGERAFPAMLEAIDASHRSILLTTYIFQHDEVGERFIEALARAHERGADVRVIVDGIGELYSLPRLARTALSKRGVRVVRFLPPRLLPPSIYVNLRTHHKLLVVDGEIAFTGGMNLSQRHLALSESPPARAADMHFQLRGPVVAQLEQSFRDDWHFCVRNRRRDLAEVWPGARRAGAGESRCRVVVDGPNDSLDSLGMLLVAAMAAAEQHITVLTPYFLPSREMVAALQTAALRGVVVSVVLPQ